MKTQTGVDAFWVVHLKNGDKIHAASAVVHKGDQDHPPVLSLSEIINEQGEFVVMLDVPVVEIDHFTLDV